MGSNQFQIERLSLSIKSHYANRRTEIWWH